MFVFSTSRGTSLDPRNVMRWPHGVLEPEKPVMGNLIGVQPQGSPQTCAGGGSYFRYFTYDPLGRLTGACNPESGLITYTYDDANNKMTRTQAGVTTTTVSDGLHRITSKTFSDTTPEVTWIYDDPAIPYSRGRLTKVVSSAATRSIGAYDNMGRVLQIDQKVGTFTAPPISHTWNRHGLSTTTLPSGRIVSYEYDGAGRVNKVSGGGIDYASSIQYAAHGAVKLLSRGDTLVETTTFNSRVQPVTIQAGSLLKLDYDYGGTANNNAGLNNNGNVVGQTITRGNQQWTQAFLYDGADRLACANEVTGLAALACGAGAPGWIQMYGYDGAGNRAVTSSSFTEDLSVPGNMNQYSSSTNRIGLQSNGQPMPSDAYDAAGNLHNHPWMGTFSYDAENRMTGSSSVVGISTSYAYDGEGRRVSKTTTAGTVFYVYDAMGELAAEYSAVAVTAGRQYLTVDALGSTRLVTNADGTAAQFEDYLPFGEQVAAGTNGRSAAQFSAADIVPQKKFTGKERDSESGLDYFGFRYYSGAQGRWTSPDQPFADQHPEDPQSWNMYGYVRNNPLSHFDPNGKQCEMIAGHCGAANLPRYQPTAKDVAVAGVATVGVLGAATLAPEVGIWAGLQRLGSAAVGWALSHPQETHEAAASMAEAASGAPPGSLTSGFARLGATTAESVERKLSTYLLNADHPVGGDKAQWFQQALGFTKDNLADLAKQIVFDRNRAVQTGVTEFGTKYNQTIALTGANGRTINVVAAWIRNPDNVVRLVTAVPEK